jgi:putative ABC transport system ATP-binding protein
VKVEWQDLTIHRGDRDITCPDAQLSAGQSLALVGPSGVGKTSLLLAFAGLLRPKTGAVRIDGNELWDLSEEGRARRRGRSIGYVFASFHLIDALSVLDNLQIARTCAGLSGDRAGDRGRARDLLNQLGLDGLEHRRADRLSQGQMQRVAVGRALMNKPSVLLCDEPTAALDDVAARALIALLRETAAREEAALVVATHDARVMNAVDRVITLSGMEIPA